VLLASSTQQKDNNAFLAYLTTSLSLKFSGMPVADGSSRLAMACNFFGGLTHVSRLATV